jgi:SAM-dependent methyltransferase
MSTSCELLNTYEVLEHVMGIKGLHPHRRDTIRDMRLKLVQHVNNNVSLADGVVLDIGCGSGAGASELAAMFTNGRRVIGLDINGHAIENARRLYGTLPNLSFYHGDLKSFLADSPDLKVSAAICISVSMFIHDVGEFYGQAYHSLLEGGIFIDAPFMFRSPDESLSEDFRSRTYAVCGCNMKMFPLHHLKTIFQKAGFSEVACIEHDFDLMKLPVLFNDYPARHLLGNFFKNVMSPPAHFGKISSGYLFIRTVKIFLFFLKNRHRYAGGEFVAVKPGTTGVGHESDASTRRGSGANQPNRSKGDN